MTQFYEAEVIIGIEDIAIQELNSLPTTRSITKIRDGFIRFSYDGNQKQLNTLKTIIAIYSIHHFDIPRPKALLGHENFTKLIRLLSDTVKQWEPDSYTVGLGAAGSTSSVMQRIKQEIAQSLHLPLAEEEKGNLYIRLIPAHNKNGWEALIRLTPTPLATRSWRLVNIPGALNATVAQAMLTLASIDENNHIVNLCSGTATILIEQALLGEMPCHLIAIDNDTFMLNSAQQNITASQSNELITQICGEAQQTPIKSSSIHAIFADLPFGHHMGSHQDNEWLYPAILEESARIAHPDAKFILITHEIQLIQESIQTSRWKISHKRQINLNGLHPYIFVLERI